MAVFFPELVTTTDEARRRFENHPVILDAVANGMPLERYRALLLELYHLVWHFNPTCAAAASRLSDDLRHVRYFLYEHMQEESGHEIWVLNDLHVIGVSLEDVSRHIPTADTLALVGYNYWIADRRDPSAILGMMYVLEVIASVYGGPFSTAIKESLLLEGDRGVSFIGSHAAIDVEHMAKLRDLFNTIETPVHKSAILESIGVNFQQITRIFSSV